MKERTKGPLSTESYRTVVLRIGDDKERRLVAQALVKAGYEVATRWRQMSAFIGEIDIHVSLPTADIREYRNPADRPPGPPDPPAPPKILPIG